MSKGHVMGLALACLFGCAASAAGRDVPVYREYTVPISFSDGTPEASVPDAGAPDIAVFRSLQDAQARETLLGKETLMDLALTGGSSVFGQPAALPGKMTQPAGDDGGRRKKGDSGQNWLVKSLNLPKMKKNQFIAAASRKQALKSRLRRLTAR